MSDAKPSIEQTAEQIWEALKLHKLEDTPYEWLIEGWIPKGELSMYTGQFASLKTYLEFLWTKAICTGTPFADRWEAEQHNVLILDRQSGKATLTLRRNAVGLNNQQNVVVIGLHTNPGSLDMELDNKVLEEICRKYRPAIFMDSLVDYIPNGRSEQDPSTMREVMRQFTKLIISGAVAVVILHHKAKDEGSSYRGTTAIPAATALSASLSKKVMKDYTRLDVKQFKGRDSVERKISLKFVFRGEPVENVTCTVLEVSEGETASLEDRVKNALEENPGANANAIVRAVGGRRERILKILASLREESGTIN